MKTKLIVIMGPTAVGKSALGIELASKYQGEIISGDSQQVYRGLDIGTAKVSPAEQAECKGCLQIPPQTPSQNHNFRQSMIK